MTGSLSTFETGPQDWDFSCGVCHVGGGQMEYDRDMNAYDPASSSSDNKYFSFDRNQIVAGFLSSTNKAEIDCLMCHLNNSATGANESGTGRAWYQSMKCGQPGGVMGPVYDPNCQYVGPVPGWGLPGAGKFDPGTAYDPVNRNLALKTQQFNLAPSLGIGATVSVWGGAIAGGTDPTYKYITSITGVPSTILGVNIQGTPASQNCSACHARDDNAPAYPGMMTQVRMGYGNMVSLMGIGQALDVDQCTAAEVAAGNCPNPNKKNTVPWIEFGCKTGMGKRGQKIGNGKNSYWGLSMFNMMFALGKNPGDLVVGETLTVHNPNVYGAGIHSVTIKEKIPDQDVHDAAGFQCATCHYAIGSSKLGGVTTKYGETFTAATTTVDPVTGATYTMVTIPAETNAHGLNTASGETGEFGVNYPAETIYGIDHQFAQGDNLKDTYGKNNLDGTVSCEGCHVTRTHPRVVNGSINPPIPTHGSFPAIHIDKISCTTCHIPEIYITPFNLKSRDWTIGFIKRGNETNGAFKNIYDWNYDLVTGSGAPLPLLHMWATKYEKKQIFPISPAEMPIWVSLDNLGNGLVDKGNSGSIDGVTPDDTSASTFKTCSFGSRIFARCSSDAECPGGYCVQGETTYAAPAKTRDVMAAAETLQANQSQTNPILRRPSGNLNTGSIVPLFDGWPFPDGQGIDTKARIDNMIATATTGGATPGTVNLGAEKFSLLKVFHAPFDITHGIVPKEWALGGSKRGGCVSCHSSAQPRSFDAYGTDIGPNPNYSSNSVGFFEGMQHWMPQEMGTGNFDLMKNPLTFFADFDCTAIVNGLCASADMCEGMCMGMMHNSYAQCNRNTGFCAMRATQCSGAPFTDANLFGASGFAPTNNAFLQACISFMQPNFDMAMGWPNGTAAMMGMMDGVNGLQAFTIRETLSGNSDGCNPMIGPKNVAIMNFGGWNYQSDPNAIANATNAVNMLGNQNSCMPAAFGGTCTGAPTVPGYPATCVGGFRAGGGCIPLASMGVPGADNNADCAGTLPAAEVTHVQTTPTQSLILSRGEARNRFKLQLQQSAVIVPATALHLSPNDISRVWWPILTEQNPDNANHKWAWDQAGSGSDCGPFQNMPCCTDPMTMMPTACTNGMNISTTIHANQLLGFSSSQHAYLMGMFQGGTPAPAAPVCRVNYQNINGLTIPFDASSSLDVTSYSWNFGDGSVSSLPTVTHTYTPGTYNVTLTGTGNAGTCSWKQTIQVAAPNNPPVANGTLNVSGNTATVQDASSDPDGNPLRILVNWGDGTASTVAQGAQVTHVYSPGNYTVYLSASDGKGGNSSKMIGVVAQAQIGGTVTGTVMSSTGSGIADAIVKLYNGATIIEETIAGSNGAYTLVNVPFGTGYTVSAQSGNLMFDVTNVSVPDATPVTGVNVTEGTATISGNIANVTAPLAVELQYTTGGAAKVVMTDASGNYSYSGVAAGTYNVVPQTSLPHFTMPAYVSVTVTKGGSATASPMTYN